MRLPAKRSRNGAAATELALLLPFLCFLFVITIDFARVFYFSMTVTNCARTAAVYASANPVAALDQTGITAAAQADASNLDLQQLQVTSTPDNATNPTYVDVTVTYPFATITNYPGVPSKMTLSRTIRMRVTPLVPG
ncbi:MAG TPA: TadE/TadG family type IV pilus assembly protein [Gemmataceae bacterium]|nr:TadE/TadG family type IV pilus assembly protein [Gemmataceae bacterium]